MPKDEFDFDDPLELSGVALITQEDTADEMATCFVEEFMRLGYGPRQLLALFRNPFYLGPNLVLQKRGEPYVRERIGEIFARWGRPVVWTTGDATPDATDAAPAPNDTAPEPPSQIAVDRAQSRGDTIGIDPTGAQVGKLPL